MMHMFNLATTKILQYRFYKIHGIYLKILLEKSRNVFDYQPS